MATDKPPEWAVTCKSDEARIDQGYTWDQGRADRIVRFAEEVYVPAYIEGDFDLLEWQSQFLQCMYGWVEPDTGRNGIKTALLGIPKKNGKTTLVSIICLYELLFSKRKSPAVKSCSTTKKNAAQVHTEIQYTINHRPMLKKYLDRRVIQVSNRDKTVWYHRHNASYEAMAYDPGSGSSQGFQVSTLVIDELHSHPQPAMYQSLKYATAASGGLTCVISTAGQDKNHFFYPVWQKGRDVQTSKEVDPTYWARIYEADKSEVNKKEAWRTANPSLGTSFGEQSFENDLNSAKKQPIEYAGFLRYRLNVWTDAEEDSRFIDLDTWDRNAREVPEGELARSDCVVSIDLSQTTDPTSCSAVWKLADGTYHVKSWAWVPEDGYRQREAANAPVYADFPELTRTPGGIVDYDRVRAFVLDLVARYPVECVAFDPNGAQVLMAQLEAEGLTCHRLYPSYQNFDAPMKHFSALTSDGKLTHDGGKWLRYCVGNCRADRNKLDQVRLTKAKNSKKIDGAYAAVQGFAFAAGLTTRREVSVGFY